MKVRTLNRGKSKVEMGKWISNEIKPNLPTEEYYEIREELETLYKAAQYEVLLAHDKSRSTYLIDVYFGISIFDYFNSKEWFSLRLASNEDFWRYISILVIPHIIKDRWGLSEDRFWKKNNRIWLSTIWWYANLCYTEDVNITKRLMSNKIFTTDTILNLVDRTGKMGFDINLYREIMYQLTLIPYDVYKEVQGELEGANENVFRVLMKLNTARVLTIDPDLCENGVSGYVNSLFIDTGLIKERKVWI